MNRCFKVLAFFAVVLLGVAAASKSNLADGVKVQVVDAKGKPIGGEQVHIFKKGEVKCKCENGKCVPAAVAAGLTKSKDDEQRGPVGQVEFPGLPPNTEFTACIDFFCNPPANNRPCQNDQNCGFNAGICVNFKTNDKGKAAIVKIVHP